MNNKFNNKPITNSRGLTLVQTPNGTTIMQKSYNPIPEYHPTSFQMERFRQPENNNIQLMNIYGQLLQPVLLSNKDVEYKQIHEMKRIKKCNHEICTHICKTSDNSKISGMGVGIVIYNNYFDRFTRRNIPVVMFGKEREGNYKGKYNVCGGKMEDIDDGCYIKAVLRELKEEFKIDLDMNEFFNKFTNSMNQVRFFYCGNTPIFVGKFESLSRAPINVKIIEDYKNWRLPFCYKEIEHVDWFRLDSGKQLEGDLSCILSKYAEQVINLLNKSNM